MNLSRRTALQLRSPLRTAVALLALAALAPACSKDSTSESKPSAETHASKLSAQPPGAKAQAQVGQPAPEFALKDLNGTTVNLSDFKGKRVVLEWFNPDCPFVKLSHTKGSLVETPKQQMDAGVAWLAINSGGPGKQGHGPEATQAGRKRFGMHYPILADPDGTVGRAYGAERTPHIFIIDEQGVLRYRGAIDNSPDAELGAPEGGKLINYAEQALGQLRAGKPVTVPETKSYGCSVKYADG